MCIWPVLFHDIDEAVPGHLASEEAHDLSALTFEARHDEVTHEQALLSNAIGREAQVADLRMHSDNGLPRRRGIVVGLEQTARRCRTPYLKVRQVDVNESIEQTERGEAVKGGRVVDDGQVQPLVPCRQDGQNYLRHDVFRSDEVDVVHVPDILQLQEPVGQLIGRQVEATALVRDFMVLAEDAAQVAAAEEDGTAAVVPLDTRF